MRAADMGRARVAGPGWPGRVVVVEDRAATIRVITAVGPGRSGSAQVVRAVDALGGLDALEALLATAPVPELVVIDGATCGELTADVLLGLRAPGRGAAPPVLLLSAGSEPPAELVNLVDGWTVKTSEITDVPDAIRLLRAATGPGVGRVAGAA